jgi:HK97 family phage prohead protease
MAKKNKEILIGKKALTFFEKVNKSASIVLTTRKGKFKGKRPYKVKKDERYIDGYATTEDADYVKDIVTLEAMEKAVGDMTAPGTNTLLFNHRHDSPIGKIVGAVVDDKGIFIQAIISKASDVEDIWTKIKEGIIHSFSISFMPKKIEVIKDEEYNIIEYRIKEMSILETSVTPVPMNANANIENIKGKSFSNLKLNDENKNKVSKKKKRSFKMSKKANTYGLVKEIVDSVLSEKTAKQEEAKRFETLSKAVEKLEAKLGEKKKKAKSVDVIAGELTDGKFDVLMKKITDLETKLSEKKVDASTSKKSADDADDNSGENKTEIALKSIEDEATLKFIAKAMDSDEIYNSMNDEQKEKCNDLYIEMLSVTQ